MGGSRAGGKSLGSQIAVLPPCNTASLGQEVAWKWPEPHLDVQNVLHSFNRQIQHSGTSTTQFMLKYFLTHMIPFQILHNLKLSPSEN